MIKKNIMQKLGTLLLRSKNILVHGDYVPTEFYVLDKKNLVYISIPKVACTSFKIAMLSGTGNLPTDKLNYMRIHKLASTYCYPRLPRRSHNYFKFAFVRNPLDRLVSCYEDKVRNPVQHNGKYYFSSRYNHTLIKRLYGAEFSPEMSFDEFVRLVARIPDKLSDGHFKSQYSVLYKRKKLIVDYIGKFESLAEDWNRIAEQNGLCGLEQKNSSDRSDWESYYSTGKTIELVANRYQDDILSFGYQGKLQILLQNISC